MVAAMIDGGKLSISGISARDIPVLETFSLRGFDNALRAVVETCDPGTTK